MGKMLLTIMHSGKIFSPPVTDGVEIEWPMSGSPGKLTFTTVKIMNAGMSFSEGDPVCFYYDDKPVFVGYVFTKKRDKEHHIKVTCYDQIRYLKNKFTYAFEDKTASEIIKMMCEDFKLNIGEITDTKYVIPSFVKENTSALDIILAVLQETLLNTGVQYVLYDDCGKICLKNALTLISNTLIYNKSAENFDYTSSIDSETYNSIILYSKGDNDSVTFYTASNQEKIEQWGVLRYFEEVKTPAIGQNKADTLLKLYCKKTRELKVNGAFGSMDVRGGSLIPVMLDLGDIQTKNFMLVDSVTHKFNDNLHTMDLTLEGAW